MGRHLGERTNEIKGCFIYRTTSNKKQHCHFLLAPRPGYRKVKLNILKMNTVVWRCFQSNRWRSL